MSAEGLFCWPCVCAVVVVQFWVVCVALFGTFLGVFDYLCCLQIIRVFVPFFLTCFYFVSSILPLFTCSFLSFAFVLLFGSVFLCRCFYPSANLFPVN